VAAVVGVAVGVTILGSFLLRLVDPAAVPSVGDAFWLAIITVTTVGYGDIVPTNSSGRVVAAMLALLGISLIPVLTSVVVSVMVSARQREDAAARGAETQELIQLIKGMDDRLDRLERHRAGPADAV